jgi:multiple sugar transport system substrate-binding protein
MLNRIQAATHFFCVLLFLLVLPLNGCGQKSGKPATGAEAKQPQVTILQAWAHAGQAPERQVLQSQVERFNEQTTAVNIKLTFIPEREYNAQVQAAALAGDLPDVLEFDGPYLYNYIWQNHLVALETLLPQSVIEDLLPSVVAQGTYGKHLYSVGVFDSGLGLYGRKSALQSVHARIPTRAADAWRIGEFNELLARLAQQDKDHAVLDLKLNYAGEWFTYGFSPILQSAGADLINRDTYLTSTGTLNSVLAVAAMQNVQNWIQQGLVDPDLDDAAFISGRVVLSWVGHWEYARYKQAWQDDLVILPLPDFGKGSKTGQGSWNWGITRKSLHPQAAAEFIRFLLQTNEVLAMCNANGAVPGTRSAVSQSSLYGAEGDLRLFADQLLQGVSVPRPKTPAYPVITTAFQQAFQQIRNGANVKQALGTAAMQIDEDIRDNQGYPFITP